MNTATWPEVARASGSVGLKAFQKVWYGKEPLSTQEHELLQEVFRQYPMGVDNYKVWLKQRVRQLAENFLRERERAIQV